jgi:predicted RNA-binding protein YlqC (UPF0109 family)
MADYTKAVHGLIDPLVDHPENIIVRELPSNSRRDITILIMADDDDIARLIGKRGVVANALREAVGIASKADDTNTHIHLKFESFKDSEEPEEGDAE